MKTHEDRKRAVLGAPQHIGPNTLAMVVREVCDYQGAAAYDAAEALHYGLMSQWWHTVVGAASEERIYRAHVLLVGALLVDY